MKIWMFIIATAAILFSAYLMLAHKKWKIGAWILCLSLAIFAGSSLNIGNLISVGDAFKYSQVTQQVASLSNDVQKLQVQMVQSVTITQQISQTVNMVTEVRKEVADVRALVTELFSRTRIESVRPTETNRLSIFEKADGAHIVAIRLNQCPMEKSATVVAFSEATGQLPILANSLMYVSNYLLVQWDAKDKSYKDQSYTVSYVINIEDTNIYDAVSFKDSKIYINDKPVLHIL